MRIAIVLPSLGRGGAERVALDLAGAWSARHEIRLFLLASGDEELETRLPLRRLGGRPPAALGGKLLLAPLRVWRLAREWRRYRPEAIVGFMEAANLPAALAAALCGRRRRLIATLHTDVRRHRRTTRLAMRLLYPGLTLVTPTEGLARDLLAAGLARRGRVRTIPNPLPARGARPPAPLPVLPERYLAAVGRLTPEKDFALLLDAYALVAQRCPDLVIAGEGPERDALGARARRLGLAARVRFPGYVEDIPALLRGASLLVLSSRREGWSLALVEALDAGLPVVALDCPHGPREILDGGRYGLLVEERSARALAGAILATLEDAALLARFRRTGPERAAEYRMEAVSGAWQALLESSAAGGAGEGP